jgi:hypothetical protein
MGYLKKNVLILVLMEYGLWQGKKIKYRTRKIWVLILVLMEYGLWPNTEEVYNNEITVLILVLMEYGLWRRALQLHSRWRSARIKKKKSPRPNKPRRINKKWQNSRLPRPRRWVLTSTTVWLARITLHSTRQQRRLLKPSWKQSGSAKASRYMLQHRRSMQPEM